MQQQQSETCVPKKGGRPPGGRAAYPAKRKSVAYPWPAPTATTTTAPTATGGLHHSYLSSESSQGTPFPPFPLKSSTGKTPGTRTWSVRSVLSACSASQLQPALKLRS